MKRTSIYTRQFALMAAVILLSFALLGSAFAALSYRFTISERQETLKRNATIIANMTGNLVGQGLGLRSEYYQLFVASAAQAADAYVIVAENDGEIIYCAGSESQFIDLTGEHLPQSTMNAVARNGQFSDMSNLGGLFPDRRYVSVQPITVRLAQFSSGSLTLKPTQAGVVLVAASSAALTEMWRSFATIFLFTAVVVLFIAFIASSVTSMRQAKPLKEMAEAAKRFGHGEFDVRVETGGREDEVAELAEAFNQMAEALAQAEAERSEFIANVSHELKTPMTTIAGFADGILDGTIPP